MRNRDANSGARFASRVWVAREADMAGTIDNAVEKKRDENPQKVAEKQHKLESDPAQERERKRPHESPRETPKSE